MSKNRNLANALATKPNCYTVQARTGKINLGLEVRQQGRDCFLQLKRGQVVPFDRRAPEVIMGRVVTAQLKRDHLSRMNGESRNILLNIQGADFSGSVSGKIEGRIGGLIEVARGTTLRVEKGQKTLHVIIDEDGNVDIVSMPSEHAMAA